MKKIMFDDKYGLTKAVLDGRKTMTRRIIKTPRTMEGKDVYGFSVVKYPRNGVPIEVMALDADGAQINNILPKYKVGEVVAVAQSYKSLNEMGYIAPEWCAHSCEDEENPAYNNKMFVLAELMPHHIRITNVRVERLQDISDDDCKREGLEFRAGWTFHRHRGVFASPREAFAALINRLFGNGTWESNPWVFVYEFVLVK